MIAALFVEHDGPYANQPGIDAWCKTRDARTYAGPYPVIAHPPCERWGRYWFGGPSCKVRKKLGDDGGCFAAALEAVRKYGGVLEHPAASLAWKAFGLSAPPFTGGWVTAGDWKGWTCHVEQGHYGHRARKATWLYAVADDLPILKWGPSSNKVRIDEGFHSNIERARARCRSQASEEDFTERTHSYAGRLPRSARAARSARERGMKAFEHLGKRERRLTPEPFKAVLAGIAQSCLARSGL